MVVDTIFAFLLIVNFFFLSTSMANILLLGGVSVRQHHSYRLLLIHSRNIVSFRVKFFVHCEAMLFFEYDSYVLDDYSKLVKGGVMC